MKVLFDLSTFKKIHCGGKDEVAYNLLRGFSLLGFTQNIICVCRKELVEIIKDIDSNYNIIEIERYEKKGRVGKTFSYFTDFKYKKELQRIVSQNNVNCVVFSNKFAPGGKLKVKSIIIPHDIQCFKNAEDKNNNYLNMLDCFRLYENFKDFDGILAISDFDKEEMSKHIPRYSNKVKRIYDPIRFNSIRLSEKPEYITAINIQWPHKNVFTLIKAFVKVAAKTSYNLLLIGKNDSIPNMDEIMHFIQSENIADRVIFTGFVNDNEMKDLISKTRLYVNPSLFEGFGMTAVEMMGYGIPTIVAKNTAQPEATLGLCRYYEPSLDSDALATAIFDELANPTPSNVLKDISHKIKEQYDYVKISKEYWEYFSSMVYEND